MCCPGRRFWAGSLRTSRRRSSADHPRWRWHATRSRLGLLFFLFAVGLETDLSLLRRWRRPALSLGLTGSLVPLAVGSVLVAALPPRLWGPQAEIHP